MKKKLDKNTKQTMRDSANLRDIIFESGSGSEKNKVWVEFRNADLKTLYHASLFDKKTAQEFCRRLMSYFESAPSEPECNDGELDDYTEKEWNKIARRNQALFKKAVKERSRQQEAERRLNSFDSDVFQEKPYAGRRLGEEPEK